VNQLNAAKHSGPRRHQTLRITPAMEAGIVHCRIVGLLEKNRMKKKQHRNSEASLSAGLAPEFRRTRGDKVIDYGLCDSVSRKSRILVFDLLASASG